MERPEKSEEKQARMVSWKTAKSVPRNGIISCQMMLIGQGRWGLRNDYWFGNVNAIGDVKKGAVFTQCWGENMPKVGPREN